MIKIPSSLSTNCNTIDTFDKYFIVQIDRWPCTKHCVDGKNIFMGQYGDTYICNDLNIFHSIESFDSEKKQIKTKKGKLIQLHNEPDHNLFLQILGNEWDNCGKELWKNDENKTDYVPYYYETLDDYLKNKPTLHNNYIKTYE